MSKPHIHKLTLILTFAVFVIVFSASFAQALEVEYPELPGGVRITDETNLPELINYIYTFSLYIVGLIGLGVLTYAGLRWMTSVGNPSAQADAKDQITQAVIGIILLLGSYLLLYTINPALLRLPEAGEILPPLGIELPPSPPEEECPNPAETYCGDIPEECPNTGCPNCPPDPDTYCCGDIPEGCDNEGCKTPQEECCYVIFGLPERHCEISEWWRCDTPAWCRPPEPI